MQTIQGDNFSQDAAYEIDDEGMLPEIDLHQVLAVLKRNRILIAAIVLGIIILSVVFTMLQVPRYQAVAKVLVEQSIEQIVEGSDLNNETVPGDADRYLQTQIDIIGSRSLAQRVVETGGLGNDPKFFDALGAEMPDQASLGDDKPGANALEEYRDERAADLLRAVVSADLPPDSRVISIKVETNNPAYSARLANAVVATYISANLSRKFASSDYARKFLGDQLQEARERLESSERDLNQYSRAAGLIRLTGNSSTEGSKGGGDTISITSDTLMQANVAAGQATAERIDAEDRWETIAKQPILTIPQVLASSAIQDLMRKRSELTGQLADERTRHLDSYPTVVALRAQIDSLNDRAEAVGKNIKQSIYLDYAAAREKETSFLQRVEGLRTAALNEQDRGVQYNLLKRVADTNRALYDSLLERSNQLNAGAGASSNNISLVDAAEIPKKASSPNIVLNVLLAGIFGVVVAAVMVLLREYFDNVLRSPEDIERKFGLPLMGVVPMVPDGDVFGALDANWSEISEAYHTVVTNLTHATAHGLPRVLLITSSGPAQGKTTSSHALASDLARLGKKVLLIDGDLRRPTLHAMIKDPTQAGLTALITGESTLEDVIQPSANENLKYLTALPVPPNPTVLLASSRMEVLLQEMRERFDVIVIDSAPMLGLSDAALISTMAEGVLLIVDASQFHQGAVKASIRRLKLVQANILGVVLTKFDPKSAAGSYAYYGYNYYSYETKNG